MAGIEVACRNRLSSLNRVQYQLHHSECVKKVPGMLGRYWERGQRNTKSMVVCMYCDLGAINPILFFVSLHGPWLMVNVDRRDPIGPVDPACDCDCDERLFWGIIGTEGDVIVVTMLLSSHVS